MLKLKIVLVFLIASNAFGINDKPVKSIAYNVVRNNTVIGTIEINKYVSGDSIIYKLESNIEDKCILKFKITGREEAIYKDGILVYSSVYRTLNNKVKANHRINLNEGHYKFESSGETTTLSIKAIEQNLILLYFKEPKGIERIYCDNLNQMVNLQPQGNGMYKVDFSNGKYNIFYYQNGKCVRIDANSTLFKVTLIPS